MNRFVSVAAGIVLASSTVLPIAHSAEREALSVKATAYNAVPQQTGNKAPITAWGDKLKPGMRSIAVSRDLIKQGLTHGTRVKIEGLPGSYVVRDKMNKRWRRKIDIYMGNDIEAAREWGLKKDVEISWTESSEG